MEVEDFRLANAGYMREDVFAYLTEREDRIMARFLEIGTKALFEELRAELGGGSYEMFYGWIRDNAEREQRWDNARNLRGHFSFEEAQEIAANATQKTANADRLRYEGKKWAAEVQNRRSYGKSPDVVNVMAAGESWLHALTQLAEQNETPTVKAKVVESKRLKPGDDED